VVANFRGDWKNLLVKLRLTGQADHFMASHSLKRKAEELSALVDRINGEIGAASTGKKSRLDPGLTAKT
jgi:hypothetical protein